MVCKVSLHRQDSFRATLNYKFVHISQVFYLLTFRKSLRRSLCISLSFTSLHFTFFTGTHCCFSSYLNVCTIGIHRYTTYTCDYGIRNDVSRRVSEYFCAQIFVFIHAHCSAHPQGLNWKFLVYLPVYQVPLKFIATDRD